MDEINQNGTAQSEYSLSLREGKNMQLKQVSMPICNLKRTTLKIVLYCGWINPKHF